MSINKHEAERLYDKISEYERHIGYLNRILDNTIEWLEDEVENTNSMQSEIKKGEVWQNVTDRPDLISGRLECAESLLNQIKKGGELSHAIEFLV